MEGLNFLDAHSASTKCSPSRYMLMTGRYNFGEPGQPSIRKLKPGTPHLGELFKRNGYKTAIIGKHQPIQVFFEIDKIEAYFMKRSSIMLQYSKRVLENINPNLLYQKNIIGE